MNYMELNKAEQQILESYKTVLEGLSQYLGDGYELILHSLENLDHSVIKIINGHYTGRAEGAPITNLALKMLEDIEKKNEPEALCYFNKKNGSLLKSATIPILGEQNRIIGLLCMNFHMEASFASVFSSFFPSANPLPSAIETFSDSVENLIAGAVDEARTRIHATPSISSSNKNKAIIHALHEKGIFNMKDSAAQVADCLGISKNTVYLHLRNLEKEGNAYGS